MLTAYRRTGVPLLLPFLVACAAAPHPAETRAPDLGKRAVGRHGAVTSAHPLASDAGLAMLQGGGNAIDAAVATAFAIGVVEPEMSGVGGGGALLAWHQATRTADYLDFYPSQPVERWRGVRADSTVRLRIAAVPGNVAGLLVAHERFGRLPRAQVLAPAILLAERGFPLYPVLAEFVMRDTTRLGRDSIARRIYWRDGRLLELGDSLRNAALAEVLRKVAADGRDGFYKGVTARALVTRLAAGGHPATLEDLAAYEPQWKRPLCTTYRGRVVLSAPPPMGGVQFLNTLELLETGDLSTLGLPTRSGEAFDLLTSAMRVGILAHAGNDDPRWATIPARGLVSQAFAAQWRDVVGRSRAPDSLAARDARPFDGIVPASCEALSPFPAAVGVAPADGAAAAARAPAVTRGAPRVGVAPGQDAAPAPEDLARHDSASGGETTHISVVDRDGNAVSVTVTNSSAFGAKVMAAGFWINDSGWWPRSASAIPTTLPAQWRTRITTIAPSVLLKDGRVDLVVGSPGGGRIAFAMAQAVAYATDFDLDPLEALRMPRIYPTLTRRVEVEAGFEGEVLARARAMGYLPVAPAFGYARVYLIARRDGQWVAAADPRHDGQARAY
ncbi:MAG: gamma-glutamyltransferase [Gemmatimonadaceae bacterium]|nr:gamma-glutamyltransferase [Gemmatimonadaceae bacterium]